jgi:hypothetical protein
VLLVKASEDLSLMTDTVMLQLLLYTVIPRLTSDPNEFFG